VDLVDHWKNDVQQLRAEVEKGSLDKEERDTLLGDLNSLDRSLEDLKATSISEAIKRLVAHWVGPDQAKMAQDLYTVRSRLVHAGKLPDRLPKGLPKVLPDIRRTTQKIVGDLLLNRLLNKPYVSRGQTS
jgi:hypothetical protein